MGISYRSAHRVAHAEVKATLFIHGVVQTRQIRKGWPGVVKGVVMETVVGTARADWGGCFLYFAPFTKVTDQTINKVLYNNGK